MESHIARRPGRRRATGARQGLLVTSALVASLAVASPALGDQTYWPPADETAALGGHGYGHGRGMSQYGAKGAAESGRTWQQILAFYYPGTSLDVLTPPGSMRVLLTANRVDYLRVSPAPGLRVREVGTGKATFLDVPDADRWEMRPLDDGRVEVWHRAAQAWKRSLVLPGNAEFRASAPLTLWRDGWEAKSYRGALRAVNLRNGRLSTVNVVGLEDYVRGVVPAEMPATWSPAAVQAQSVAARTYAVRHRSSQPRRWFHVDDTISYQVYGGRDAEHPSASQAVGATQGTIVTYGGQPALTEFSSSSGGLTSGSTLPYQVVQHDPYDAVSGNPNHNWSATVNLGTLESRYGLGDLQRIVVTEREGCGDRRCDWGGRVAQAQLEGTRTTATVSGNTLRTLYGLRSTWFTMEITPIIRRWRALGGAGWVLGSPVSAETATAGGEVQVFSKGWMFHHARTGAREVHGGILATYRGLGGPGSFLGFPTTDERDGRAPGVRLNQFQRGTIYWSRATGAREIHGAIRTAYHRHGGEAGRLGLPTTNEIPGRSAGVRRQHFQRGSIYWSKATGAREIHGAIRATYHRLGADGSVLGAPTTEERSGAVAGVRLTDFQRGTIYWSRATGAHEVHGGIRARYRGLGAEKSTLGLPVSNEYAVADGRRNDFEHGWIHWNSTTGRITVGTHA